MRFESYDAVAVLEVGLSGAPDEDILRPAVENGRILVTLDADFANVMRFPPEKTRGVVRLKVHPCCTRSTSIGRLAILDDEKIRIRPQAERPKGRDD